jgi:hypothetical protein
MAGWSPWPPCLVPRTAALGVLGRIRRGGSRVEEGSWVDLVMVEEGAVGEGQRRYQPTGRLYLRETQARDMGETEKIEERRQMPLVCWRDREDRHEVMANLPSKITFYCLS